MAKVGSLNLKVHGKNERCEIHYNQKRLFEIKGLPEEVFKMTGTMQCNYATEAEMHEAIDSALRKYHDLIASEKKVIIYRLVLPKDFRHKKLGRGHYQGDNEMIPQKLRGRIGSGGFDTDGLDSNFGFVIEYEVMMQVEDNGKKYFTLGSDGTKFNQKRISNIHLQMDYTEQREQFFKMMNDNSKLMVEKLLAFLGQDDEVLSSLIDSGKHKLLN